MIELQEERELAPQPSPRIWFAVWLEAAGGVLIGLLMLRGNTYAVGLGVAFILVGAAFPAAYWLWLTNTRLLAGRGGVGYRDMLGRSRYWSAADVARVVQVTIVYYSPRSGRQIKPALLLVGGDGRCLLKVRTAQWPVDAIDAFIAGTGHQAEDVGLYTSGQVASEFPGSVGFMNSPTWRTVAIVAVIAAAIVVGFLWWGLTR